MSLLKNLLHHSRVSSVHSNDRVVDLFWFEQFICLDGFSKQLISIESISVQVHQFQISEMQKNCWANFYLLSLRRLFANFYFFGKTNWQRIEILNWRSTWMKPSCVSSWQHHSSFFIFCLLFFNIYIFLFLFFKDSSWPNRSSVFLRMTQNNSHLFSGCRQLRWMKFLHHSRLPRLIKVTC